MDEFRIVGLLALVLVAVVPAATISIVQSQSDECYITMVGNGTFTGEWTSDCESSQRPGSYAMLFEFGQDEESQVTITLESSKDTFLYLLRGATKVDENDDIESGNTNSRINKTLAAGTYTIEATTYTPGEMGSFTLMIDGISSSASLPPAQAPAAAKPLPSIAMSEAEVCVLAVDRLVTCYLSEPHGKVAPPPDREFVQLAASNDRVCGVEEDGAVYCWGAALPDVPWNQLQHDDGSFALATLNTKETGLLKGPWTLWLSCINGNDPVVFLLRVGDIYAGATEFFAPYTITEIGGTAEYSAWNHIPGDFEVGGFLDHQRPSSLINRMLWSDSMVVTVEYEGGLSRTTFNVQGLRQRIDGPDDLCRTAPVTSSSQRGEALERVYSGQGLDANP